MSERLLWSAGAIKTKQQDELQNYEVLGLVLNLFIHSSFQSKVRDAVSKFQNLHVPLGGYFSYCYMGYHCQQIV